MNAPFTTENFRIICDELANNDSHLKEILDIHGYPPMWTRNNSFETLVHIILEQQVSLASALATLNKLKEKLGHISPENILVLTDEEMKACFVSRQKSSYIRGLAHALINGDIKLNEFEKMTDEEIRMQLIKLKGIGNWTIDVYLMFVLQRTDLFPVGDLALVNALKRLKKLESSITKEEIIAIGESWKPYRTVASMMLWHYYLSRTGKK
ncbi:MAG: DNA-3-methyladenine glycosylase [Flavobacteriaceae bacterium]|jgi:DNA-3-methyladenine glycosylase II|uniref:DNA-3-methyladenine glycosylase family protein n=1 Tax=Elizabethkingia ursingii TaxID=1756150 RepID=UPI0007509CA1|nr:DNA-3-methyladenine glycosylase [Elizabethkingia ursingii]KUY30314.1 3-methyladenine DNA glycosylase [Elizabethkingia ursingii]MDR2228409.1 DNA-3-methyladenine glycosylase [Flavobacteriaceae bacterium]